MDRPMEIRELRVIAKGAEADILEAEWMGAHVIIKRRPPKEYLNPALDARVRYHRTVREAEILHEAKLSGVPTPLVHFVDPVNAEIIMEMIQGLRLKELLESERRMDLLDVVGQYIGRLHSNGIVHGDPTTSNFILSGGILYAIDFGLSFRSRAPQDLASDLHVIKEALESYHSELSEEAVQSLMSGYSRAFNGGPEVFRWLRRLESSGRYRGS